MFFLIFFIKLEILGFGKWYILIPNSRVCWVLISRAGAGSRGLAPFKIRNGTLHTWHPAGILETLEPLEPWKPWNPENVGPWNPGTLEPWNLGILRSWNPETLAPRNPQGFWNPTTLEPCTPGTLLGSWNPGTFGTLETLEL